MTTAQRDPAVIGDISAQITAALSGPTPAPDPGVYPGVAMETYHSWDAASNSRLSKLRRSPAHLKAYLEEPPKDTVALAQGKATHCAVLEPDVFSAKYVSGPVGDKRTKAVKEKWEELEGRFGDGYVLKPADYAMCLKVRDAIHVHSRAHALLAGGGQTELSVVWDDPETGVRCKARYDFYSPETAGGAMVDLKSCRDASARAFERTIFAYGYHRQGWMYLQSADAHRLPVGHYVMLPFEKVLPFAVAAYRLTEGAIDAGGEQLRPLLRLYDECRKKNEWPGYPQDIVDIALPPWAWNEIDEEIQDYS